MNIPFPFLLITMLFWGWRIGHIWGVAVMALSLESSRLISWKWHPQEHDLSRVTDLSTMLLLGLSLYPYLTDAVTIPLVQYEAQILPLAVFPLMLAQAYSINSTFPLSSLLFTLRKSKDQQRSIQLDYLFFGLCLISSTAGERTFWYFFIVALLTGWALWQQRPQRYKIVSWFLLLILAVGLAYQGQKGILALEGTVRNLLEDWIREWMTSEFDPYRQNTALGEIRDLKLSDRILFRVEQSSPPTLPILLREATYNRLIGNTWHSPYIAFRELPFTNTVGTWQLVANELAPASLTIHRNFSGVGA